MLDIALEQTESPGPPSPPTSAIIVSHGRPDLLRRAVMSLHQQDHPMLEVVVVACEAGLHALAALPWRDRLKTEVQDTANISQARNIGIALAAGDVVAFLDDDAVAEPTWARRLSAPFDDPSVMAATGFTLGRSGLAWQWRAAVVTRMGEDLPLGVPEDRTSLHPPPLQGAIKTVGTNAAFRRRTLVQAGGFDPRLHYFLDDADLNLRMARQAAIATLGAGPDGGPPATRTAIVPSARVLHGYAANATRRADRAPRDLTEIGASAAIFARTHAGRDGDAAIAGFRAQQRHRLLRHMVNGSLEPRDIVALLRTFDKGARDGGSRVAAQTNFAAPPPFVPLADDLPAAPHRLLACRPWRRNRAHARALRYISSGTNVTLLVLGPTPRRHTAHFNSFGFWEQRGGLFGRSFRHHSAPGLATFRRRAQAEAQRIAMDRAPLPGPRRSVNPLLENR